MAQLRLGPPVRGSKTGRPAMVFLDLLGRRWLLRILWELKDCERMSFGELQARCEGISPSVLSQRLRDLRDAQLVEVDEAGWYLPTAMAKELASPLSTLDDWTKRWAKQLRRSSARARS